MPFMATLEPNKDYIFSLKGFPSYCSYSIFDGETHKLIATNTTKELPPAFGPSYFFSLYFGGGSVVHRKLLAFAR
jgi:hypothetical protein